MKGANLVSRFLSGIGSSHNTYGGIKIYHYGSRGSGTGIKDPSIGLRTEPWKLPLQVTSPKSQEEG